MSNARERLANELHTSFMVEAAAGTGKTTSMVQRMLTLVAEGACKAEQMAAVTFTRKAAAELRERFQRELAARIDRWQDSRDAEDIQRCQRLRAAAASLGQTFIGTIHSFCTELIRQRPIEFGVNPGFRELEADENKRLMDQAWHENLANMIAASDPLLGELQSVGLETSLLRTCFNNFLEYRDVEDWPSDPTPSFDLAACQASTRQYIEDMKTLTPSFPRKRGTDALMNRYEQIVRSSARGFDNQPRFFRMLEHFDHSDVARPTLWHDKDVAKLEKLRFDKFRQDIAQPALLYWRQRRYHCVVQFVRRALGIYEQLKQFEGALDFTDLLLTTAQGLREQPHLRSYFQQRFTHLLVDEFQDTDPIQAEAVVLLSSDDANQRDWQSCRLRPGSLLVVGDPKQSIYRFRRGDIVTYNRVRSIFTASGGALVSLTENYRSSEELLAWNNDLFATKFPIAASDYAPAHAAMLCGRQRTVRGDLSGIYRLTVDGQNNRATQAEAENIARFIRHAISSCQTIERWSTTENCFQLMPVQARDFLIITRVRSRISIYKAALERYGVACEVSGSNSIKDNPQLRVLLDILRAADDPYNQVHYLSLLRERLFGFSDAELYELKRAGGTFLFTADVPQTLEADLRKRFELCCQHMRLAQLWLRTLPPIVALNKIGDLFGLLAEAASGDDGNIALGSLFKAFEVLRSQSHQFDNAADLIEGVEQLLLLDEADSVRAIGNAHDAVRIMNLHKAKGLEAPIVFLVDTARPPKHPTQVHISRKAQQPAGAMCITIRTPNRPDKNIAEPVGWEKLKNEEQRFLDAEEDRLLYVATTRAANMLVVSLSHGPSAWSALEAHLKDAPQLSIPKDAQLSIDASLSPPPAQLGEVESSRSGEIREGALRTTILNITEHSEVWRSIQQPSYSIVSVKKESLRGSRRPDWQAEGEYGMVWGTVLHELLEIASQTSNIDWRAQALAMANEYDLPAIRVDELVETVQAVMTSEIWQRSRVATRCYSELSFDVPSERDGQPAIVRGVIDLIFEEPDGWVIVDYKSDNINIDDIDSLCDYYRPQLAEYAQHWQALTGFKVKELGIFVTRLKSYHRV